MRDILVTCFSEHAVRLSEATCSSGNYTHPSSCMPQTLIPSVQNTVISMYKVILSTKKQQLITVTWCRDPSCQGLSLIFGNDPSTVLKLNPFSRFFKKNKGSRSFDLDKTKMEIFWDLSAANYGSGAEPIDGYYLILMVDSELGLILGDLAEAAAARKLKGISVAKFSLVSRREHYSGNALYSTKAQFCDTGMAHDILIRCCGENDGAKQPVLSISIDKRTVLCVKRLQWNFRGNQTIFVDGLLVDLFWDVHDWFFNRVRATTTTTTTTGYDAVFMFRTRRGMESRLWLLEEKVTTQKEQDKIDFSLLIHASKIP